MRETIDVRLDGKVAMVTGGAVRIGRALALALAGRGARVALHYGSSTEAAAMTVAAIHDLGGSAEAFQADLRDISRAEALIGEAAQRLGPIDILVNSAAIFTRANLDETTEPLWDNEFAVNLKAPFFLARAFARHVGKDRPGQIVNVADWRAVRPEPGCLAYSLTKAGIVAMTKGLALALAPNIRVNAIVPGAILPPPGRDKSYLEQLAENIPLRRHGSPTDVANALLYLITSPFVTGQVLFVDGGEHLGGSGEE
ncbi:MAG TPA: SDR family oxidoreductase [Geobacteraceae bacterium]|nr:SDR family oxidoreductase [Geobacteraceae bacterium]